MDESRQERSATGPLRLLLVATVVLPLLLLVLVARLSYLAAFKDADRELARAAEVAREHADKVFDSHRLVAERAIDLVKGMDAATILADEPALHQALAGMIADLPQVRSVAIISATGHPLVSAAILPAPHESDVSDRDFFHAMQAGKEATYISEVYVGRLLPTRVFGLSERLPAPDGGFVGLVNVAVPQPFFDRFYASLVSQTGDTITLARDDGGILVRYPAPADPVPRLGLSSGLMTNIRSAPISGRYVARSAVDGIERVYTYRRLDAYPVYVLAGRPTASIVADWRRKVAGYLLFGIPETLGQFLITLVALRRTRREQIAQARARIEIERRQAAEAALRQAQKLEALGQLTGGVAHDFNNLLLVIGGNVEVLRRRLNDPGAIRSLDAIERAAGRGERLTRHLLSFSRRKILAASVTDLSERLPSLREMLEGSLPDDIRLALDLPDDLWPVEIDSGELELALLNLAVNARDAMPRGGRLLVSGRNQILEPNADTGTLSGEVVALTIRDTGQGIPPDILARVFEPFFTTKEVGKGTGLGLSQVYGFAQQSGGVATVRSNLGQGTEVTLYLPRSRKTALPLRSALTGQGGGTVLLVEDNPEVGELARALLEEAGYQVLTVPDAETALDRLAAGEKIDLLLSDIVMPGIGGLELARRLRISQPGLPILLVTGYSEVSAEAEREGFRLLRKPYHRGALEAEVRAVLTAAAVR